MRRTDPSATAIERSAACGSRFIARSGVLAVVCAVASVLATATFTSADPSPLGPSSEEVAVCPEGSARFVTEEGRPGGVPSTGGRALCIDRTEVTVAAYARCVSAGACSAPATSVDSRHHTDDMVRRWSPACNANHADRADHPVNCVSFDDAQSYCAFVGGRLPSASEWVSAARGGRRVSYPWGGQRPTLGRMNGCGDECAERALAVGGGRRGLYPGSDRWPTTAPVGSFPQGANALGLLDMVGNVEEWTTSEACRDERHAYLLPPSARDGYTCPRVTYGGSWTTASRDRLRHYGPMARTGTEKWPFVGVRCVYELAEGASNVAPSR